MFLRESAESEAAMSLRVGGRNYPKILNNAEARKAYFTYCEKVVEKKVYLMGNVTVKCERKKLSGAREVSCLLIAPAQRLALKTVSDRMSVVALFFRVRVSRRQLAGSQITEFIVLLLLATWENGPIIKHRILRLTPYFVVPSGLARRLRQEFRYRTFLAPLPEDSPIGKLSRASCQARRTMVPSDSVNDAHPAASYSLAGDVGPKTKAYELHEALLKILEKTNLSISKCELNKLLIEHTYKGVDLKYVISQS
ncbi:hypothetical protein EVAR_25730_1 [Eumeta japonica]|uniref:Uncharacterized protein n=1 Tax=Eumeta variegata TaxID=151549 RepID=A0A4C1V8C3_EUMVA|nr:hypothetical protein EVAR_25730_1 [Eumeta japonica]